MQLASTQTTHDLCLRPGTFFTLTEALDYAAKGATGANFYTGRGKLYASLPYKTLRLEALRLAGKLLGLGVSKGDRVALIAETHPDFLRFFFACQYAGLVPVPLPVPVSLGGEDSYQLHLRNLLINSRSVIAVAPESALGYLEAAAQGLELVKFGDHGAFDALPESNTTLPRISANDLAYIQYTSGSTQFPRGVMIPQRAVMSNLKSIITHGLQLQADDRFASWLPFYHDMGMIGLILVPVAGQRSVDYLDTREFAMRPRQWIRLISESRATLSFSPTFGYELCARRLRPGEADQYDLSCWRIAGIGAEMINPDVLDQFAEKTAKAGFDKQAFMPCYGMAETTLAVSFAPPRTGYRKECINLDLVASHHKAAPIPVGKTSAARTRNFVDCGELLPEYEIEIRDDSGNILPDRSIGAIFLRGMSIMTGYFDDPVKSKASLSEDSWLDTGDMGYLVANRLFITGRKKDLIIINGRNIWPQDLEYLAETQLEIRTNDTVAFAAPGPNHTEICILLVQCRQTDPRVRAELSQRLRGLVSRELGIDCQVELVAPRSLPRTSSGKLSRARARQAFLERSDSQPENIGQQPVDLNMAVSRKKAVPVAAAAVY